MLICDDRNRGRQLLQAFARAIQTNPQETEGFEPLMKSFIRGFFQDRRMKPSRAVSRLGVEELESRLVLSLTYHGGPLLVHADVEILYYGSQWSTDPTLKQQANQISQFFQTLADSAYMDMLNEYGVGRGSLLDSVLTNAASPRSIDDTQIQSIVIHDVGSGVLQFPDSNRVYFVFTAPGNEVTFTDSQGTLNTSGNEANVPHFDGYHSAVSGTLRTPPLYYAVIPYPGGVNTLESGFSAFQQITATASHELAEAATDPDTISGWIDDSQIQTNGGEIADLANGQTGTVLSYDVAYIWSNALGSAILPRPGNLFTVAAGFTTSTESYTNLIIGDYQHLLGRTPSQFEIHLWLRAFQSGTTDEQVTASFLASPEFYQHAGGTNRDWVDALYATVLDRKPDSSGESSWVEALSTGQNRYAIAYGFTSSSEHEQALIQADYQLYLGRGAASAEVSSWLSKIQHGMTQEAMAAEFAASAEAFFFKNNSDIDSWLAYAYQTILDRQADQTGLNSWEQALNNGLE
jgi:hypothetical protein